ncbi:porin [Polycladidibacter stylochi]|uniref:porin n=1 Tax=Polycladidibacter stylochi TaxID=1807766 RepID=UPI000829C95C|nr:porin [Pseudovibrio stylochi]
MRIRDYIVLFPAVALLSSVDSGAADLASNTEPLLPDLVEPVEYVRVCDSYGAGYFFIPGTDTCLRISGRVRAEVQIEDFGSRPSNWSGVSDQEPTGRLENGVNFRARASLSMDARTETEFGLLRSYMEWEAISDSDDAGLDDNTLLRMNKGYVQFYGFTVGRARSVFDYFTGATFGSIKRNWSDRDTNVAAFTAMMSNGVSVSFSLEDRSLRDNGVFVSGGTQGLAGNKLPDGVAALRIDQAWGSAQASAAIKQVRALDSQADGATGFALGAGVIFNIPFWGEGDAAALQVQYAQGALDYIGFNDVFDATYDDGKTKLSRGISVSGGLTHYFSPAWRWDVDSSYARVEVAKAAPQQDFQRLAMDMDIVYMPVNGVEMGVDFGFANMWQRHEKNRNEATALFRVQRDF